MPNFCQIFDFLTFLKKIENFDFLTFLWKFWFFLIFWLFLKIWGFLTFLKFFKNFRFFGHFSKKNFTKISSPTIQKYIFYFVFEYRFKLKIVRRRFFPKHLVINFKTLTILYFSEIIKVKNIYYPIKFNKKLLSRYYR